MNNSQKITTEFINSEDIYNNYNPTNNISSNRLSKYEKTKIIGIRISQLSNGNKPYISDTEDLDYEEIAYQELNNRKLPFLIKRMLPNGTYEYWKIKDMIY